LAGQFLQGSSREDHDRRLANEILDASNGLGAAVKRREDTHKMAEATGPSRTTLVGGRGAHGAACGDIGHSGRN